jgi:hypothetical protein
MVHSTNNAESWNEANAIRADGMGMPMPNRQAYSGDRMTNFSILTSIPPRTDAGRQKLILDSWRQNGFTPISVNPMSEAAQVSALGLGIGIEVVSSDGKPLIADILNVAQRLSLPWAGIVNADCSMLCAPDLAARMRAGIEGKMVHLQRIETVDGRMLLREHCYGFDGFFFDTNVTRSVSDDFFRIGECWWDYWLPVKIAANGGKIAILGQPLLLHETHENRWSIEAWRANGEVFWRELRRLSDRVELPQNLRKYLTEHPKMGDHAQEISVAVYKWLRGIKQCDVPSILPEGFDELLPLLQIERPVQESENPLKQQLDSVLNSTSWKITAPLRRIAEKAKRLRSKINYSRDANRLPN